MSWQYRLINEIFSKADNNDCPLSMMNDSIFWEIKKKHCPESLFKFYAPTIENVSDVQSKLLWLADPSTFNDPYDCKLDFDIDEFKRYYTIRSFQNTSIFSAEQKLAIYRMPRKKTFYDKFSTLVDASKKKSLESFKNTLYKKSSVVKQYLESKISDKYRIACFSSYSWDSKGYEQLMWAHYARSHKGFCVEYDISPLFTMDYDKSYKLYLYIPNSNYRNHILDTRKIMVNGFFPVQYSSKQIEVPKSICYAISKGRCNNKQLADINIKALRAIITKQQPWHYEREWRLIVDSDISASFGNKIPFPFARKIYIGCNASEELKRVLIDTAKLLNIPTNLYY